MIVYLSFFFSLFKYIRLNYIDAGEVYTVIEYAEQSIFFINKGEKKAFEFSNLLLLLLKTYK